MPDPKRDIALIQFLPNAITLGAIAAGVTALRMAVDEGARDALRADAGRVAHRDRERGRHAGFGTSMTVA